MFRSLFTALFATAVLGVPTTRRQLVTISSFDGETVPNSFIVKLKNGASHDAHISRLPFGFSVSSDSSPITHDLKNINAYAGTFEKDALDAILADEDVEYVAPNGIMRAFGEQTDAPWGLQSISTTEPVGNTDDNALTYTYTFDDSAGEGTDIYIIDTGIFIEHTEFEGRATFGWAPASMEKQDGNGHGTHCAGTAAGKTYGVAKKASIIAVKVLSDEGSGSVADIVEGIQFVVDSAQSSGKPTVASMSLGGGASQPLDDAVAAAIEAGITFTIAAGNANEDAANTSPARVPAAITVGASNIANEKAEFSNFGEVVDIWAPGENIISAWIDGEDSTNNISGTSMATPHVAGLAAYLLGKDGAASPAKLAEKIVGLGTKDALTGVPSGTVNLLAYNGAGGESPEPTATEEPTETETEPLPTETESEPLPTETESEPFPTETESEPFPTETELPTETETDPFPTETESEEPFPTETEEPFPPFF